MKNHKSFWVSNRPWILSIAIFFCLFFIVNLALTPIVFSYVNKHLAHLGEYEGHVGKIRIHLWAGEYVIENLVVRKRNGNIPVPFLSVKKINLGISWRDLFKGKLVSDIELLNPILHFVDDPDKSNQQTGTGVPWTKTVTGLFPIRINRFTVDQGEAHFHNFQADSLLDIFLAEIKMDIVGLTNRPRSIDGVNTVVDVTAIAMGHAPFKATLHINPFAKLPMFNLSLQLRDLRLTTLNSLLRTYGKFDVEEGKFSMTTEMSVNQGEIKGYLKPILTNVEITSLEKIQKKGFSLWEVVLEGVKNLFENQSKQQVATRIPLSGTLDKTKINVFTSVVMVLYNAFIEALTPELEQNQGAKEVVKSNATK